MLALRDVLHLSAIPCKGTTSPSLLRHVIARYVLHLSNDVFPLRATRAAAAAAAAAHVAAAADASSSPSSAAPAGGGGGGDDERGGMREEGDKGAAERPYHWLRELVREAEASGSHGGVAHPDLVCLLATRSHCTCLPLRGELAEMAPRSDGAGGRRGGDEERGGGGGGGPPGAFMPILVEVSNDVARTQLVSSPLR